jgi:hypothetical protein
MASELAKGEAEVAVFLRFLEASCLPIDRNSIEKRSPPEPDILCMHQSEGAVAFELKCAIRDWQDQLPRQVMAICEHPIPRPT